MRVAVGQHSVADFGQSARAGQRGVGVEKRIVIELEHSQINAGGQRFDVGRELVPGLVGLDLHLAGVENQVGVGEDALALDDHAAAADLRRRLLGPGLVGIRVPDGGEDFDD